MSHHNLDVTTDFYNLYIDNKTDEDSLDDTEHSTAGNFTYLIQPQLDLASLLFLKSIEAEISLSKVHLDSLPLTMSRLEECEVFLDIPLDCLESNRYISKLQLSDINEVPLKLALDDHICHSPSSVISYVNTVFSHNINHYIIARYLTLATDSPVMLYDVKHSLTGSDIKLIDRYLDITLFSREVIHKTLCGLISLTDDISSTVILTNSTDHINQIMENELLSVSQCLTIASERDDSNKRRAVNLQSFYGINLKDQRVTKPIISEINDNIITWLQDLQIRVLINRTNKVSELHRHDILEIIDSNKTMINMCGKIRSILRLEQDRNTGLIMNTSILFHQDIVTLDLDVSKTRCQFSMHPKQFLYQGSKLKIILPELLSYSLGSELEKQVTIGPFDGEMPLSQLPRLTNNILSPSQRLYSKIRNLPSVLHFACDIAVTKGVDSWLRDSPFNDYQILYSHMVDESNLHTGTILSVDERDCFFKIKQANKILENVRFVVLNDNLRECIFPQRTYVRLALKIRPVTLS